MNVELLVSTYTCPATSHALRQESCDRLTSYLKAAREDTEAEALADALLAQLHLPDAQARRPPIQGNRNTWHVDKV